MSGREAQPAGTQAQRPGILAAALQTVEQAWLHGAQQTSCWKLEVKDEDDGTVKMNAVKLSSGKLGWFPFVVQGLRSRSGWVLRGG